MSSHVVQVRAQERDGRTGSYYRGDRHWSPGWHEHVVSDEVLAVIEKDPWLDVRALDPRAQAAKKKRFAAEASHVAAAAEAHAKELRAKADAMMAEADAELEAVGHEPPPEQPPNATPYQDAHLAAMPDQARKTFLENREKISRAVDEQKTSMATSAAQIASLLAPPPGAPSVAAAPPATPVGPQGQNGSKRR